jgi:hypothetical protein
MAKFKELERFRLENSLQFGIVMNNNCDGTYEVLIDGKYGQLQEFEMCKVIDWSKLRSKLQSKIENSIIEMMDFSVAKMIFTLLISAMIVSLVAFIHALFLVL